jgi:hypothetical protein
MMCFWIKRSVDTMMSYMMWLTYSDKEICLGNRGIGETLVKDLRVHRGMRVCDGTER